MFRKKKTNKDKSLDAIFKDESGKRPNLNTIERHLFPRSLAIGIGAVCFIFMLVGVTWTGSGLLRPFVASADDADFALAVHGPESISLGKETVYFINWQNSSLSPLTAADIRVSFPPEFTPTSIEPRGKAEGLLWDLGAVRGGAKGTFTIKGIFNGSLGKQTAIQAVANYRPAKAATDLEELYTLDVRYADTVVTGTLELPPKALSGDKVRIAYHVENTGLVPLKDLEMRITLPKNFIPDGAATDTRIGTDHVLRLPIGELAPSVTTTLDIVGSYSADVYGDIEWQASLGYVSQDGEFRSMHVAKANMAVLVGDLSLKLVVNGSDGDRAIGYGEPLHFTLGYQNASTEELKNVVLRLSFNPIMASGTASGTGTYVQWDKLDLLTGGNLTEDSVLVWDESSMGVLERLRPDQDGSVEFSLPSVVVASGSAQGFQVTVEASVRSVGNTILNRTVRTTPVKFLFRTDADITAEARYFSEEGAPLGAGPLPPVLGQNTSYRIGWMITKSLHEIKDIIVSAALPKNVSWPDKVNVTAGDVTYDEQTRRVMWKLNRLPEAIDEARVDFDVQLTPSEFDVGRFADLMGETRFEAADAAINEPIIKMKPGLSTDLATDEGAKNKGVVRKP